MKYKRNTWNDEEISILKIVFPNLEITKDELVANFPRHNYSAIFGKASRLGMKNSKHRKMSEEAKERRRWIRTGIAWTDDDIIKLKILFPNRDIPVSKLLKEFPGRMYSTLFQKARVLDCMIPNGKIRCIDEEGHKNISLHHADFSERYMGENNPAWKGGISNFPYCLKFNNEFKERVRKYFNRCCYVCGKNEIDNGQRLSIHHVSYNKDTCCDDSLPLFVPLCRSCHIHTNGNRDFWKEFFEISLSYLTNNKCYLSREEMEKRLK